MDPLTLFFVLALGLIALFLRSPNLRSPSDKGALGESMVHDAIAAQLSAKDYSQFHDITLETIDGETQIDHIVVSPYGVFVIETKNYEGWIFGDAKAKQWTQVLYGMKFRFQNPLRQNYKHVKAVESFLALQARFIHSVVVFVGDSEFKTTFPSNVTDLYGLAPYIRSKMDQVLSEQKVSSITHKFSEHKLGHSRARKNRSHLKAVNSDPLCPRCGNTMVRRTARKGKNVGKQFWGCSQFPRCKTVKDIA